jgi:DNA-binding beta-propeller fold protein YncE
MANLIVILRAALGSPEIARTNTDSNGKFSFTDITVGTYILEALNSSGVLISSINAGVNANSTTNSQLQEGSFLPTPTPTATPTFTPDPRTPTVTPFIPQPPPPGATATPTPTGTPPTATPTPTGTVSTPTPTGTAVITTRQPHGIAITTTNRVYVAEFKSNSVAYFLPGATTATHITTGIGTGPEWIATTNTQVFVTNYNGASISQITDGAAAGRLIPLPSGTNPRKPMGITVDSTYTNLYIIDNNNADLLVVTIGKLTTPLPADPNEYTAVYHLPSTTNARYITYKPGIAGELYVTADNKVLVLNAGTPLTLPVTITTNIGNIPMDIDLDSTSSVTANFGSNSTSVINTSTQLALSAAVGGGPYGVDIFHDLSRAFVGNSIANTISEVDLTGIVAPFVFTGGTLNTPYDLTSGVTDGNYLYVTNSSSDNVFRINTGTKHVDTITDLKP